jgi:hypothetical protein
VLFATPRLPNEARDAIAGSLYEVMAIRGYNPSDE